MIDNLIFRSSATGGLCGKTGLGATGEKLAIKTYLQKRYGRYKEITNKYLEKGIACEDAGIKSYNSLFDTYYVKNDTRVYNDFITGECDIDTGESIIDIKNSWDLFTFHESKTSDNKLYDWQGQCYMELYDRPTFQLVYVLEDAPDLNIFKEINYAGEIEEWEEVQIIANMVYSQSEFGYEIINKFGAKLYGVIRTTRMESEDYYLELIQETKKAFHSMEQPFNTTETK